MPLSKSIHMYHDIHLALTAAREAGGAIFRADSPGQATSWRLRTYYYRKLLADADVSAHGSIPGYSGSTEWDDLTLTINPADPTGVRIQFGVTRGKLESLDGGEISITSPKAEKKARRKADAPADADLLAAAQNLAVEIDKS